MPNKASNSMSEDIPHTNPIENKTHFAKMHCDLSWNLSHPFISSWHINKEHIDHYGHTNNVAYLSRLESLAWEHSNALGLHFSDYKTLDRAMVITQHELNYHLASHLNDTLACATWLVHCDNKFKLGRRFQFINTKTKKTVFTARTEFVCVSLQSGRPKKMPQAFIDIYGKAVDKTRIAAQLTNE